MTFEKLEHSQIKASFEVSAEEFTVALDEAFKICNEKVTIDGFRKGKAPKSVYLKRYGVESLYADAIDAAVSKKMREELLTNPEIQNDTPVEVNELPKVAETPAAVSSVVEEEMELPVAKTTEGEENK